MNQIADPLAAARSLIAAGRFDQALKLLRADTAPDAHALRAAAHLGRRDGAQALIHYRMALDLTPGDPACLLGLGRAHLAAGEPMQAIAVLEDLVDRAPDHPGLAESLAGAYRRDARLAETIRVAESHAASEQLLYEKAMAELLLGEAARALDSFDRLLALAPELAAAWFWSHAPALDLLGWHEAERRIERASGCRGANRKYQAFLSAYDLVMGREPRPCPAAHAHLPAAVAALAPLLRPGTRLFGVNAPLLRWALGEARQEGLVLEFGVRRGTSIRILADAAGQRVHGFDSFEGLPEGWANTRAGVLTTGGELPAVPANVSLHPGWFEDSLPPFLDGQPGPLRFANMDCDIYSSTRTVLWALAGRMIPGSVLVFDEFIGNRSWRDDEFKAFREYAAAFGTEWECIAVNLATKQVALRMLGRPSAA